MQRGNMPYLHMLPFTAESGQEQDGCMPTRTLYTAQHSHNMHDLLLRCQCTGSAVHLLGF